MKISEVKDKSIKLVLEKQVSKIEPSKDLFQNIKMEINNKESALSMKNRKTGFIKGRRLVTVAASFAILFTVTAFAVTMGKSWVGHTSLKYTSYPSEKQLLKDVGYVPKYPESLPGDFEYVNGGIGESQLTDEKGEVLTNTKDITLGYKNLKKESEITLNISKKDKEFIERIDSNLVGEIEGIELYYYNKNYKFVPADYELTKEDKAAKESGDLEISYGSSEVRMSNIQSISWYEDGLEYIIISNDQNFKIDEMIQLAEAVINK